MDLILCAGHRSFSSRLIAEFWILIACIASLCIKLMFVPTVSASGWQILKILLLSLNLFKQTKNINLLRMYLGTPAFLSLHMGVQTGLLDLGATTLTRNRSNLMLWRMLLFDMATQVRLLGEQLVANDTLESPSFRKRDLFAGQIGTRHAPKFKNDVPNVAKMSKSVTVWLRIASTCFDTYKRT